MNTTTKSAVLILSMAFSLGCDDTAQAIDDRAEQERAELRAEVEHLKADLKATELRAKNQVEELERRLEQAGRDTKDAARETTAQGSRVLQKTGEKLTDKVDEVDKAVAEEIRDDG
jgi:DNA anti-recombination protein RmuC